MDRHALLEKSHMPNYSNRSVILKKIFYRPQTGFADPFLDESTNVHQLNASALLAGFSLPSHSRTNENINAFSHRGPKDAVTFPGNPAQCLSHTHCDSRREVRFKPLNVNLGEYLPEEEITPAVLLNIHRRDSRSPNVDPETADCVSQCFEDEDVVDGPLGPSHAHTSEVVRTRQNAANSSCAAVNTSCSKEATIRKQSAASITSAASIKSVRC